MNRAIQLIILVTIPTVFAGCDSVEKQIKKATGLTVVYNDEASKDGCVSQQLSSFVSDYHDLSSQEQADLKNKISAAGYTNLVMNQSQLTQTVTGYLEKLSYYTAEYGGAFEGDKTVVDSRVYTGTAPVTQLATSTNAITLTPEYSEDKSDLRAYVTYNVNTYSSVVSDDLLTVALKAGNVVYGNDDSNTSDNCSPMIKMSALISN